MVQKLWRFSSDKQKWRNRFRKRKHQRLWIDAAFCGSPFFHSCSGVCLPPHWIYDGMFLLSNCSCALFIPHSISTKTFKHESGCLQVIPPGSWELWRWTPWGLWPCCWKPSEWHPQRADAWHLGGSLHLLTLARIQPAHTNTQRERCF